MIETKIKDHPVIQQINRIANTLENVNLYLVGGAMRHLVLGHNLPLDLDFSVIGIPAVHFAQIIADQIEGRFVILDEQNDTGRVVLPEESITLDFTGCVGETIQQDLWRRDYTINALACHINTKTNLYPIIDVMDSLKDLQEGFIKAVSEENIVDDPLRILRAFRFQSELGFKITPSTYTLLTKHISEIQPVAKERVGAELLKLFEGSCCYQTCIDMLHIGLLETIIPKISDLRKVPPNQYHNLPLLEHTFEVLKQTEYWYTQFPDWAIQQINQPVSPWAKGFTVVKLSAVFHDIAKPDTWKVDENGKHSFLTHEVLGASFTETILSDLALGKDLRKTVAHLVRYHLRPFQLSNNEDRPSLKAVYRFFRDSGQYTPHLLLLAIADSNSVCGPSVTQEELLRKNNLIFWLLDQYHQAEEDKISYPLLLDGDEIMHILSISPGPLVGNIKKQLEEEQALGNIQTKEQAITWVKTNIC